MKPRILIACESSGRLRDALIRRGHDAVSCDVLPTETPGPHIQDDIFRHLDDGWDAMIAFWPCTRLCNSGVRWLRERNLWGEMNESAHRFRALLNYEGIPIRGMENPVPHHYALDIIGSKYDQIIQPWQFGHKETKATCLWLRGLPLLMPTKTVGPPPKDPTERRKWAVVHNESPGPNRSRNRSRTRTGIADAMAAQWGPAIAGDTEEAEPTEVENG